VKKLRVSYTLLSVWASGRTDDAVNIYLHKPMPKTRQMEEGIKWDEMQMKNIEKEKKLTKEFNSFAFIDPKTQMKLEIPYNEKVTLVIKPDVYDSPMIMELKTGKRSASSYLNSKQLDMYGLGCHLAGLEVGKIVVIRYDQYKNEADWAFKYMDEGILDSARNYIDSLYPEIYEHFNNIGIL